MLTVSDESMLKDFEEAEIKSPAPKKVINSERTIYASRNFRRPRNHAWGHPVLCDFGEGSIGRKHAYKAIQPTIYKAPEIVMESEWSHSADIWNVGCMVCFSSHPQRNSVLPTGHRLHGLLLRLELIPSDMGHLRKQTPLRRP